MTAVSNRPVRTAARPKSKGLTYQELLDTDTRSVPAVLRSQSPVDLGDAETPIDWVLNPEMPKLERDKLWRRVWQVACREEVIPEVGDTFVYDVSDFSIVIVRSAPDRIQAFLNACLHQGRRLRDSSGPADELRCAYHGFSWNLDGSLKFVPCKWDFPQVTKAKFGLPEVPVGTWGGFVFVNPDPESQPLEQYLGTLSEQFERWPLEDRYTAAHVIKVIPANWKIAQEAFMESFHVIATHPQLLAVTGDANAQYDVWGNFARAITATGTPSPHLKWTPDADAMASALFSAAFDSDTGAGITNESFADRMRRQAFDGEAASAAFREATAEAGRAELRPFIGDQADELCDAEMMDSFYYTVFPNFHPWGAYNRITFIFRPYGMDNEKCTMETYLLSPFKGERPAPVKTRFLGLDDDILQATELGQLARVVDQDMYNMPKVQSGLKTLAMSRQGTNLSVYQQTKIRHFYRLYAGYLGLDACDARMPPSTTTADQKEGNR